MLEPVAGRSPLTETVAGATRRTWLIAGSLVIGFWVLLAFPWLIGRVTIPYDAKALFQAQLQFLATALHSGQSPAWNPHIFVGLPQIADPQSLIFSPALLLASLDKSPGFWLLDVYVFALLGAAAMAVMMLFRDRGWHPGGAAVAAICFAFGGSASWRIQHIGQIQSYAFFAVTLWLLLRALDRRSGLWALAAGCSAGLMIVEPDQVAFLACYLLAFVVALRWILAPSPRRTARADIMPLLVAAVAMVLLAAIPLALTYTFLSVSNRPAIPFAEAARGSLHPASLLTFFIPDLFGARDAANGYWGPFSEPWDPRELTLSPNMSQLYIGALPCLLLIESLTARGLLRRPEIIAFTCAAGASLAYAIGASTPIFGIAYEMLPGVSLFRRPADATFMLGGFLSIVAGYLLHVRLTNGWPADATRRVAPVVVVALLSLALVLALKHDRLGTTLMPIATALLMLVAARAVLRRIDACAGAASHLWAFLPALLICLDLAAHNGPNESTGKPVSRAVEALLPGTRNETIAFLNQHVRRRDGSAWRDRIEIAGIGFDWQNAAEAHGFDQTLGYNPLRTALVSQALGASDYIAGPEQRSFSPLFPTYRCRLADLLGLRYIATPVPVGRLDRRLGAEDLNFIVRTPDAYIYENPRALPRAVFAERAQAADFTRILADGRWPDFDPLQTVLLDRDALLARRPLPLPASVEELMELPSETPTGEGHEGSEAVILRYENTRVDVAVRARRPGYLVLGDVWHPWWNATVDGRVTEIHRANVMFRAVAVPAGHHRVRFEFQPLTGALTDVSRKLSSAFR